MLKTVMQPPDAEAMEDAAAQSAEVSFLPLNYKATSLCTRLFDLS